MINQIKLISIIFLGLILYFQIPVKSHLLNQKEKECNRIRERDKIRVFNCEFKRIRKPNNTFCNFQYKFSFSEPATSKINRYKVSSFDIRQAHSYRDGLITVKFNENKIIREKGVFSEYGLKWVFISKSFQFNQGTSGTNFFFKGKNICSVFKHQFLN